MSWPTNGRELYDWFREEMDSEGRFSRHWGELAAGTQIAWGKFFRRLQRESLARAETSGRNETNKGAQ